MHVGMWGLAAIVVVIPSWRMYRYLAPDGWKEWTRAGVLQASLPSWAGTSGAVARRADRATADLRAADVTSTPRRRPRRADTWRSFALGLAETIGYGIFFGLVFAPLYNFFLVKVWRHAS